MHPGTSGKSASTFCVGARCPTSVSQNFAGSQRPSSLCKYCRACFQRQAQTEKVARWTNSWTEWLPPSREHVAFVSPWPHNRVDALSHGACESGSTLAGARMMGGATPLLVGSQDTLSASAVAVYSTDKVGSNRLSDSLSHISFPSLITVLVSASVTPKLSLLNCHSSVM